MRLSKVGDQLVGRMDLVADIICKTCPWIGTTVENGSPIAGNTIPRVTLRLPTELNSEAMEEEWTVEQEHHQCRECENLDGLWKCDPTKPASSLHTCNHPLLSWCLTNSMF